MYLSGCTSRLPLVDSATAPGNFPLPRGPQRVAVRGNVVVLKAFADSLKSVPRYGVIVET
jgi:hypothetical protein